MSLQSMLHDRETQSCATLTANALAAVIGPTLTYGANTTDRRYFNSSGLLVKANENEPRRAVVCDLELACGSGAALSRIPVHMAKEAAKSGDIPENVLANFSEVLNVYMSLLEGAMSERVVLGDVVVPGAAKPDELNWGVLKSAKDTANFEVDLGSYGMRSISVLAL